MNQIVPVSLIIPMGDPPLVLKKLLQSIYYNAHWPAEIIIVDAAGLISKCSKIWESLLSKFSDQFSILIKLITPKKLLYPGEARNEGLLASNYEWIAFLDTGTIPEPDWLVSSYQIVLSQSLLLLYGSTVYHHQSSKQLIFIQATYGEMPIRTLPGSLVHKSVFHKVGIFLPGIRAGEDTDWMIRCKQFQLNGYTSTNVNVHHYSIPDTLLKLARKWYKNYSSCAPVVYHLESQKYIYIIAANLLIGIVALNWNAVIANWNESSLLYLANITKITLFTIILGYALIRGLLMPLKRGTKLKNLLAWRWFLIAASCLVLDLAKLAAFSHSGSIKS